MEESAMRFADIIMNWGMHEKPHKRILTVFLAVLILLCLGGRKEST